MKFNSVIHIRAERDTDGGGQTPAEAFAEIDRKQKDPAPLTKCARVGVSRADSVNPPPGAYSDLEAEAQSHNSTLCPRCLYVENHPLLKMAVRDLAVAQAQEDLSHIYIPGGTAALCGAVSESRISGLYGNDPFHVCLACAVDHERLQRSAAT